jgi:hypothetical protein
MLKFIVKKFIRQSFLTNLRGRFEIYVLNDITTYDWLVEAKIYTVALFFLFYANPKPLEPYTLTIY